MNNGNGINGIWMDNMEVDVILGDLKIEFIDIRKCK